MPAVRLKRWSWMDSDGDSMIASGDQVTITATVVNHLADAHQLNVALVAADDYPFLDMTMDEADIGSLAGGDSAVVTLTFSVDSSAPSNQPIRFYTRIRDGAHEDEADMISLGVNQSLDVAHQSLSALYIATGGDNWRRNTNWDITTVPTEEELAQWEGVVLDQGWLVGLRLSYNDLTGELPAELGNLAQLQILALDGNSLSGALPPELGNLSQLAILDLSANDLFGALPPELGNLSQLAILDLSSNDLTGALPPELGNLTQLSSLDLRSNDLSGALPSELGELTQLTSLSLGANDLTGVLPPELGNLSQLTKLSLGFNALTGVLPPELGNLTQLTSLLMARNSLSGAIPPELGNLAQLRTIFLGENSLSGALPPELGSLAKLEQIVVRNNALTGRLPRSLMQCPQLRTLQFGGQDLCAPQDSVFQAWLSSVEIAGSSTCIGFHLAGSVEDQTFTKGVAIAALTLPEGADGTEPYTYTFGPELPTGLVFDHRPPTISGTPTVTAPRAAYTYTVSDADPDEVAATDSRTFGIEVVTGVTFTEVIADHSLPLAQPMIPLVLPEATGGAPPLDYTLTPALPEGLAFDDSTRTISGTPTVVTSAAVYTFKATGANGSTDHLVFSIRVHSPGGDQRDGLPAAFALHGNYPNPFQRATQIVFDLPWRADVTVDVLDVLGRRMLSIPSQPISGGWERRIYLSGVTLPSGLYLFRVHASAQEGEGVSVLVGRFVRIR